MKTIFKILELSRTVYLWLSIALLLCFFFLLNSVYRIQIQFPRSINLRNEITSDGVMKILQSGFIFITLCVVVTLMLIYWIKKNKALGKNIFPFYFVAQSLLLIPIIYVINEINIDEIDFVFIPLTLLVVVSILVILDFISNKIPKIKALKSS